MPASTGSDLPFAGRGSNGAERRTAHRSGRMQRVEREGVRLRVVTLHSHELRDPSAPTVPSDVRDEVYREGDRLACGGVRQPDVCRQDAMGEAGQHLLAEFARGWCSAAGARCEGLEQIEGFWASEPRRPESDRSVAEGRPKQVGNRDRPRLLAHRVWARRASKRTSSACRS